MAPTLDRLAIDTIRTLSMDAVQKANSGHPGAPMGAAPMAYVLWTRFLRHAPTHPDWPDRDRFVLSAGHASMLLYSLLHLTGYGLGLEELQQFRQWGSRTPGPPGARPDARRRGDDRPARPGLRERGRAWRSPSAASPTSSTGRATRSIDHWTYVIASDGDLQEGIASEAASLAGHLRLGKLVVLYDDNHIQLDGPTDMAWSEDVSEAVRGVRLGRRAASRTATTSRRSSGRSPARATNDRPSLIAVRTHIGFGSPNKQDTQKAHGSPLGEDEVRLTKEALRLGSRTQHFLVPPEVRRSRWRRAVDEGEERVGAWEQRLEAYAAAFPEEARELRRRLAGELRGDAFDGLKTYPVGEELATRQASQQAIQALAGPVPELFGGSADLSESNLTLVKDAGDFGPDDAGTQPLVRRSRARDGRRRQRDRLPRRVHPVRGHVPELQRLHARLGAARGARRPARDLRLDARLGRARRGRARPTSRSSTTPRCGRCRTCGSCGPATPTRPRPRGALAVERRGGPVALALTRQKLPTLAGTPELAREGVGARRLRPRAGHAARTAGRRRPDLLLIATGSELQLAFAAAERARGRWHRGARRLAPVLGGVRARRTRRTATRSSRRRFAAG